MNNLPDLILLELLKQVPQLSLVNRRMFLLGELVARNNLLFHFDYGESLVEDLAADIRNYLGIESWQAVKNTATRNYCIFGPEHVRPNFIAETKSSKGFCAVHGAPYGLYILDWSKRRLECSTTLRVGRYRLLLNLYVSEVAELSQIRFLVVDSPGVKQYFASVPSLQWLKKQSHCIDPNEMEAITIYMGMIDVTSSEACDSDMCGESNWTDVILHIESLDWLDTETPGLIFNYLIFEKYSKSTCGDFDWSIQPAHLGPPSPTYSLARVYKRANERKIQWSLMERSKHRIRELPS